MAGLLVATLAFFVVAVLWAAHSADKEAAVIARQQLQTSIEQRLDSMTQTLSDIAAGTNNFARPEPETDAARFADRTQGLFEALYVTTAAPGAALIRASENIDTAAFEPERLGVEQIARAAAGRIPGPPAKLVHLDDVTVAVVAALIPGRRDDPLIVIGAKRLDAAALVRFAKAPRLDGLRLETSAPADMDTAYPLTDATGAPKAWLVWDGDRPGEAMIRRFLPFSVVGAFLMFGLFVLIVHHVRRITIELSSTQERAQRMIGRDPLSGLPNRFLFGERLDQELSRIQRTGEGLAVLFLDLDRFKEVNDTYGHQAGDALIVAVAERLGELLRTPDTLARFGGDEFAIIQTQVGNMADAETLARRILDTVTRPFEIAGTSVSVGISIGVAMGPENGRDRDTLMRLADTALYQAKSEGRNRYSFFASQMDETIRLRKVVEDDLRDAILSDRLTLHYQPIYSADGESIVGAEALVRWNHPKQGMIPPSRFVALAEERGLIIPLGEWVLRRACEDGKRWPGLRIAVNVSAIQFRHRDFVTSVMRAVARTGFEPSRLELELTEGVVVEDADAAEAAMMELRALGVHLALDDFGTGYSSLIYLRRFAFDKIKIDRSFLESMEATGESAILVHSIVHLGRALGLTVTAEGVETREQHRFLQALGCHQLQGYLFSKPIPADEMDRLVGVMPASSAA
jgi:diguanylate cyclase (GGDEF)-like protein